MFSYHATNGRMDGVYSLPVPVDVAAAATGSAGRLAGARRPGQALAVRRMLHASIDPLQLHTGAKSVNAFFDLMWICCVCLSARVT